MREERAGFRSYLLRIWPVDLNGQIRWRASLQDVVTGERQGFDGLEPLLDYLRMETERWATGASYLRRSPPNSAD